MNKNYSIVRSFVRLQYFLANGAVSILLQTELKILWERYSQLNAEQLADFVQEFPELYQEIYKELIEEKLPR